MESGVAEKCLAFCQALTSSKPQFQSQPLHRQGSLQFLQQGSSKQLFDQEEEEVTQSDEERS